MGQDTYIEATIYERATGRVISCEWFTVLWECHNTARIMADSWLKILRGYSVDMSTLEDECYVVFPQTALREIASFLFSCAVMTENSRYPMSSGDMYTFWDEENRGKTNDVPYKTKPTYYPADEWDESKSCFSWDDIQSDEECFLNKAVLLRRLICELDRIYFENRYEPLPAYSNDGLCENGDCMIPDSFILNAEDLEKYRRDPQAYEWKFRLFDSY